MSAIVLVVPWPPLVNRRYIPLGKGKLMLNKKVTAYRAAFRAAVFEHGQPSIPHGDVRMSWNCTPPTGARRSDFDACIKEVPDSLEWAEVLGNDSQVREFHQWFTEPEGEGRIEILLEQL